MRYEEKFKRIKYKGALFFAFVLASMGIAQTSPPVIIIHPENDTVFINEQAHFTITADYLITGAWQYKQPDGVWSATGVRHATFVTPPVSCADSGAIVRFIAKNSYGADTSEAAMLLVLDSAVLPKIIKQPLSDTVAENMSASFTIDAVNMDYGSWQYKRVGEPWAAAGFTQTEFITPALDKSESGALVRFIAVNKYGADTSETASIVVLDSGVLPVITVQPAHDTVVEGTAALFTVDIKQMHAGKWQYKRMGGGWSATGVTQTTFVTPPLEKNDSGTTVRYVAENRYGFVMSKSAQMVVYDSSVLPAITMHPENDTVVEGMKAAFAISADQLDAGKWQYKRRGGIWRSMGAAQNTIVTPVLTKSDSGTAVRYIAGNAWGADTSRPAGIVVLDMPPPHIIVDPQDQRVFANQSCAFVVVSEGHGELRYEWQRSSSGQIWTSLQGEEASKIILQSVSVNYDSTWYRCIVSNKAGSDTSLPAMVMVDTLPVIMVEPANDTVVVGMRATFVTEAQNMAWGKWQYRRIDGSWSETGKTQTTFTTPLLGATDSGTAVRYIAANEFGSDTSAAAFVIIVQAIKPVIITHPQNDTVILGERGYFSIVAKGLETIRYQWQDSTECYNWTDIDNACSNTFTTRITKAGDNGIGRRCIASNDSGCDTSKTALLFVDTLPVHSAFRSTYPGGPEDLFTGHRLYRVENETIFFHEKQDHPALSSGCVLYDSGIIGYLAKRLSWWEWKIVDRLGNKISETDEYTIGAIELYDFLPEICTLSVAVNGIQAGTVVYRSSTERTWRDLVDSLNAIHGINAEAFVRDAPRYRSMIVKTAWPIQLTFNIRSPVDTPQFAIEYWHEADFLRHSNTSMNSVRSDFDGVNLKDLNIRLRIIPHGRDTIPIGAWNNPGDSVRCVVIQPVSNLYEGNSIDAFRVGDGCRWDSTRPIIQTDGQSAFIAGASTYMKIRGVQIYNARRKDHSCGFQIDGKAEIDACIVRLKGAAGKIKVGVWDKNGHTKIRNTVIVCEDDPGNVKSAGIRSTVHSGTIVSNCFIYGFYNGLYADAHDRLRAYNTILGGIERNVNVPAYFQNSSHNATTVSAMQAGSFNVVSIDLAAIYDSLTSVAPLLGDLSILRSGSLLHDAGIMVEDAQEDFFRRAAIRPQGEAPEIGPYEIETGLLYQDPGAEQYRQRFDYDTYAETIFDFAEPGGWEKTSEHGAVYWDSTGMVLNAHCAETLIVEKQVSLDMSEKDLIDFSLHYANAWKWQYDFGRLILEFGSGSSLDHDYWRINIITQGTVPQFVNGEGNTVRTKLDDFKLSSKGNDCQKVGYPTWNAITRLRIIMISENDRVKIALKKIMMLNNQLTKGYYVCTFDDARMSMYQYIYPLFKEYGWPFCSFVAHSQLAANGETFSYNLQQMKEMQEYGAEVGNHTFNHVYAAGACTPDGCQDIFLDSVKNEFTAMKKYMIDSGLQSGMAFVRLPGNSQSDSIMAWLNRNFSLIANAGNGSALINPIPQMNNYPVESSYPNGNVKTWSIKAQAEKAATYGGYGVWTGHGAAREATDPTTVWPVRNYLEAIEFLREYVDQGKIQIVTFSSILERDD